MPRKIIVHRKSYTRKDGTYVKAATFSILDRGQRGHGKKLFAIQKGIMRQWAIDLGFITVEQRVSDIPIRDIPYFARMLADNIGTQKARRMFQAQILLRKRQHSPFKRKMQLAVNSLRNYGG